jgi:hypothetical protein
MGAGLSVSRAQLASVSNAPLRDKTRSAERHPLQDSCSPLRSSHGRSKEFSPPDRDNRFRHTNKEIERNFKLKKRFEIRDQSPPRENSRLQSPLRQKSVGSRGCYEDRNEKSVRFQPEGES